MAVRANDFAFGHLGHDARRLPIAQRLADVERLVAEVVELED